MTEEDTPKRFSKDFWKSFDKELSTAVSPSEFAKEYMSDFSSLGLDMRGKKLESGDRDDKLDVGVYMSPRRSGKSAFMKSEEIKLRAEEAAEKMKTAMIEKKLATEIMQQSDKLKLATSGWGDFS